MANQNRTPIILLILIALSFLLSFPDVKYDQLITDEDSWIENFSAIAFLVAAIIFFVCYWRSKGNGNDLLFFKSSRNLVFLGLGLLFFVAFGEEISWGQRIFGWATPESLAAINYQQETNIHNLDFFNFKNETDDSFWSFLFVLNAGRIFFYFWFSYLILIPFAYKFIPKCKTWIEKINIPVPAMWLGGLMIANLVFSKIYKIWTNPMEGDFSGSIDEILEGNYALVIATLALHLFYTKAYQKKSDASSMTLHSDAQAA